jgi:hypothetical protein
VVDDAFIALRYARRLLDGQGLTFNDGERVEGYTDTLWVLLTAALSGLTGIELPLAALALNLVAFIGNLVVAAQLSRRLQGEAGPRPPVAALLLATHLPFLSHATTGLETGLTALFIQLGALALLREPRPGDDGAGLALQASGWWIAAALTRPDAALFWFAGALALVRGRRQALGYLLPGLGYGLVLLAKLAYYGDIVPNTAYAKSANLAYFSQGFVYLGEFWLGSQGWLLLLLGLAWLRAPEASPGARRLRLFCLLVVPAQLFYVTRLGGDFMAGRFFIVLVPLLLVSAERLLWTQARPGRRALIGGLLAATALSGPLIPDGKVQGWIANETTIYPLTALSPVTIDHSYFRMSQFLRETLTDRGIRPTLATGTIGMLGYYSGLPLIDLHGLTDRHIARLPLQARGHPGHEKWPNYGYLRERRVNLVQSGRICDTGKFKALVTIRPDTDFDRPWCIFVYDSALMDTIAARAPEWRFIRFPEWLDVYLRGLDQKDPAEVAADLQWFRWYYFDHNDDAERVRVLERWLALHPPPPSREPAPSDSPPHASPHL